LRQSGGYGACRAVFQQKGGTQGAVRRGQYERIGYNNFFGVFFEKECIIETASREGAVMDKRTEKLAGEAGEKIKANIRKRAEEFKKLLFESAVRNGYGQYKTTVVVSDGAAWIKKHER
jgi:hypothetical protein